MEAKDPTSSETPCPSWCSKRTKKEPSGQRPRRFVSSASERSRRPAAWVASLVVSPPWTLEKSCPVYASMGMTPCSFSSGRHPPQSPVAVSHSSHGFARSSGGRFSSERWTARRRPQGWTGPNLRTSPAVAGAPAVCAVSPAPAGAAAAIASPPRAAARRIIPIPPRIADSAVAHLHLLAGARLSAGGEPRLEDARCIARRVVDVLLRRPQAAPAVDEARPVREAVRRAVALEGLGKLVLAAEDDRAALLVEHPPVLREGHGGEGRHHLADPLPDRVAALELAVGVLDVMRVRGEGVRPDVPVARPRRLVARALVALEGRQDLLLRVPAHGRFLRLRGQHHTRREGSRDSPLRQPIFPR